jgi:TonB family protein
MKLATAATFLFTAVLAAQSLNPVEEAKKRLQANDRPGAEQILRSAVAQNPNLESLQALVLMLSARVETNQEIGVAAQRFAHHLLQQREGTADAKPAELAVALEASAHILRKLGRTAEADSLALRATGIRQAQVRRAQPAFLESGVQCVKVGGGVTPPRLTDKQEPEYSENARWALHQGAVVLRIAVDIDGLPKDIQLVRSLGYGLDEKALEAVQTWRFEPGQQNGAPVPVCAQIEVNFRLL